MGVTRYQADVRFVCTGLSASCSLPLLHVPKSRTDVRVFIPALYVSPTALQSAGRHSAEGDTAVNCAAKKHHIALNRTTIQKHTRLGGSRWAPVRSFLVCDTPSIIGRITPPKQCSGGSPKPRTSSRPKKPEKHPKFRGLSPTSLPHEMEIWARHQLVLAAKNSHGITTSCESCRYGATACKVWLQSVNSVA